MPSLGVPGEREEQSDSAESSPTSSRSRVSAGLDGPVSVALYPAESAYSEFASVEAGQRQEASSLYLRGQIRDGEDKPLSGGAITVFASRDPFPSLEFTDPVATTNSQEEGFYQLLVDLPVSGWIVIEKPGFATVEEPLGPEQVGGLLMRDYVLAAAPGAVTGRVVDTDGRPIEGAAVFVSFPQLAVPGDNAAISSRTALTNGRGEFELVDLPLREVALIASAQGFLDSRGRVVDLNVDEDALLEFVLQKENSSGCK